MRITRRQFMRQVGVTLATLIVSGCAPGKVLTSTSPTEKPVLISPPPTEKPVVELCYKEVVKVITLAPSASERWAELRACWLGLKDVQLPSRKDTSLAEFTRPHKQALQTLIANNDVPADVADQMQMAFEQAVVHLQRQAEACCYEPLPPVYTPRQNLTTQSVALTEMTGRSDIDPTTVERARTALERDMAWLSQFDAGQQPGESENVEVTPVETEAARVLVELLLRK